MLAARHRDRPWPARLVVFGDRDVLAARAQRAGLAATFAAFDATAAGADERAVEVWHEPVVVPVDPGRPDPANAESVVKMLTHAADACATGALAALVTAPVQKSVLHGRRLRVHRPHRIFRRAHAHAARGHAARRRRPARRARHDSPAACRGRRGDHARSGRANHRDRRGSARPRLRDRRAAHRRVRAQPARRRGRASRPRGDRRHRARHRRGAGRRCRRRGAHPGGHGLRPRHRAPTTTRSSRCITTRGCRRSRRRRSAAAST